MAATSNFFNIKRTDIKGQKPGYQNTVYLAAVSWFDTIQQPAANTFGEDKVTITLDHTFLAGYGFVKCYIQPKQNTITGDSKGDVGGLYIDWKETIVFPGDTPKLQAMIEEIMNEDLLILQPDSDCDLVGVWQIGCSCNPANAATTKFDGGKKGDSKSKSWTMELESSCRSLYKGTIALMP